MTSGVISKENAEHYNWGGQCDGWHLVKSPELSIIHERVPAGGAEVRHYHQQAQQFFFVVAGIASLEVDGDVLQLSPGQGRHVPAGMSHRLANEGLEELEFLVVSVPMAQGDRVSVEDRNPQNPTVDTEISTQPPDDRGDHNDTR